MPKDPGRAALAEQCSQHETIVLYGAGSPIIADVEATCARLGLHIGAVIHNTEGLSYASDPTKLVNLANVHSSSLECSVTIPLFTPAHRKYAHNESVALGARCFNPLIDPTAILPKTVTVGTGVYINSGVTLGGMTRLGAFVFINRAASLGHHFVAEDFASIGPGVTAGGNVTIGRGAVICIGAVIFPGVSVGENAVVGGGSAVTKDVLANTMVLGNPAKIVKKDIAGYNGKSI